MASLMKRGKIYQLRFQSKKGGVLRQRLLSLGTKRKDVAERLKIDIEERVIAGEDPFSPEFKIGGSAVPVATITMSIAVEEFLADRKLHCRPRTVKAYEEVLLYFVRHQNLMLLNPKYVTKVIVESFLRRKGVRDSTRVSNKIKLKAFWMWMIEKGWVTENFFKTIRLAKPDDRTLSKALSPEEFAAVLVEHRKRQDKIRAQPNYRPWKDEAWFRPLMYFYFETGLRRSEALALQGRHLKGFETVMVEESKNHEQREVPVSTRLAVELKAYFKLTGIPGPNDYLFKSPREHNKPITAGRVGEVFRMMKKRIPGLEERDIHGYRHGKSVRLIEEGYSTLEVKEWMGHKSVVTTEGYVKLTAGHLKRKQVKLEQAEK